MAGTTITPELLVSLATLITAITALVRVLMTHQTVQDTAAKVETIQQQTNGILAGAQEQVKQLQAAQAKPAETSAPPSAPAP